MSRIEDLLAGTAISSVILMAVLVGLGVFIATWGVAASLGTRTSPVQRRLRAGASPSSAEAVIRLKDNDPTGALRLFVPKSGGERTKIARQLRTAGLFQPSAVRVYYLARSALAVILPSFFLALVWLHPLFAAGIAEMLSPLARLNSTQVFLISVGLMTVGFYGPGLWLRDRITTRKTAITRGMPNALDLLQVAVEAGLGFDAAMTRVARELSHVCPQIAAEFTIVQLEIQAGKPRDRAFVEMEHRTGVEEMASFTNAILQSAEFGTPISEALATYAKEMRFTRELKAQEKANKLPVKMSGVLAGCMMPVLLLITITPVAIRWMAMMGN